VIEFQQRNLPHMHLLLTGGNNPTLHA